MATTPDRQAAALVRAAQTLLSEAVALLAPAPAPATTTRVAAGADLQAAINAARPGDTLLLDAGAVFSGNYVLPATPATATDVITIASSAAVSGVRVNPKVDGAWLVKLQAADGGPAALRTAPGAHHWLVRGLELAAGKGTLDVVQLGDGSSAQSSLADIPHDLVLDSCWIHGDPVNGVKRGIALNSGKTTISYCYVSDCKAVGQDAQAICGWNGPGPFYIHDNYLEASGENILFGGADPFVPALVPSDITIQNNTVVKPTAWRAEKWEVKNLLELKSAQRVNVQGNVFEGCWQDAQAGFGIVFTVRNQDGGAPQSTVRSVKFWDNVVRHCGAGVNILGIDDTPGHASLRMANVTIIDNLFYDIDPAVWCDPHSGQFAAGRMFQILEGPTGLTIQHNTLLGSLAKRPANLNAALMIGQAADTFKAEEFVFSNNVLDEGDYGVDGEATSSGVPSLEAFAPGYTFEDNIIIAGGRGVPINYGPTNVVVTELAAALDPATLDVHDEQLGPPAGCTMEILKGSLPAGVVIP